MKNYVIIAFILQGRVMVLHDSESDVYGEVPKTWRRIATARSWLKQNADKHIALKAASSISILDVEYGIAELYR